MSQEVYGRRYSLIIGRPEREEYTFHTPPPSIANPKVDGEYPTTVMTRDVNSNNTRPENAKDRTVIPAKFFEWTDLHFTAEIGSSKEGVADNNARAVIKLYNLNKEEQAFIKKGYAIILRAGYNQDISDDEVPPGAAAPGYNADPNVLNNKDLPLVFIGDILKVSSEKQGEDTITTVLATDGSYGFKGIKISKTFLGAQSYREIIEDIIREGTIVGGVRFGEIFLEDSSATTTPTDGQTIVDNSISRASTPGGLTLNSVPNYCFAVHGYLVDELNKICQSVGHKAYWCLGKIYVEPRYTNSKKPILTVRNENELFYIRPSTEDTSIPEGGDEEGNIIELAMPLDGRFSVATYLRIEEGEYSGDRDIISVEFKLDYEGTDWDIIIKAKRR